MVQNLSLVPRPPAPWIDVKTGAPLPEFYRFILSLLGQTNSNSAAVVNNFTLAGLTIGGGLDTDGLSSMDDSLVIPGPPGLQGVQGLQGPPGLDGDDAANDEWMWPPENVQVTSKTTFTPTITFATPGDLTVAYNTQTGAYVKVGPAVLFWIDLIFTPTYTTASGAFEISALPVPPTDTAVWGASPRVLTTSAWPASVTSVTFSLATTFLSVIGLGSGIAPVAFTAAQFATGVQAVVRLSGSYF